MGFRVLIPSFGFSVVGSKVANLQPWRYLFQISRELSIENDVCLNFLGTSPTAELKRKLENLGLMVSNSNEKCKDIKTILPISVSMFLKWRSRCSPSKCVGVLVSPPHNLAGLIKNCSIVYLTRTRVACGSVLKENISLRFALKRVHKYIGSLIVPSKSQMEIIGRSNSVHKILYIPDPRFYVPYNGDGFITQILFPSRKEVDLLYFGPFTEERGTISLIRALRLLSKERSCKHISVVLLLRDIGSRNTKRFLGFEDSDLRVKIYEGFLERESLFKIVSLSKWVVFPYRIVASTIPISILETLMMENRPPLTIGSSIEGISDFISPESRLPYTYGVDDLVRILKRLMCKGEAKVVEKQQASMVSRLRQVLDSQGSDLRSTIT